MDRRVLDLIGEAYGVLDLDAFRVVVLGALLRAVPSDFASINDIGPEPGDVFSLVEPALPSDLYADFARLAHENPLVAAFMRTGEGGVLRLSDVSTPEAFHATEVYWQVYRRIGLEHQIAFTLPSPQGYVLGVALSRRSRDFSDEESALLALARPHLIQAYRNAREVTALRRRAGDVRGTPPADLRGYGLTRRQAEVVRMMAAGRTNADVGVELGISPRTVQTHLHHAFRKLGVTTRSAAARIAWAGHTDAREPRDLGREEASRRER